MKVAELMSQGVRTCRPDTDLAAAARLMWDGDCGIVPVLEEGELRGVITDRDICMGVASQGRRAEEIKVDQVMNRRPRACRSDNELQEALDLMGKHRVRRLPVLGREGELEGILSINDLVLEAKASRKKTGGPTYKEVVATLQQIGRHRELPALG